MRLAVGRRPDPIVDLTPMIDVVFQLVLFFMVSTTFKTNPAIQVDLPRSAQDVVVSESDDLTIWMPLGGELYLNDRAVSADQLAQILQEAGTAQPDSLVIIKADQGVSHGRVVWAMDLARARGLRRLAIATQAGAVDDE